MIFKINIIISFSYASLMKYKVILSFSSIRLYSSSVPTQIEYPFIVVACPLVSFSCDTVVSNVDILPVCSDVFTFKTFISFFKLLSNSCFVVFLVPSTYSIIKISVSFDNWASGKSSI